MIRRLLGVAPTHTFSSSSRPPTTTTRKSVRWCYPQKATNRKPPSYYYKLVRSSKKLVFVSRPAPSFFFYPQLHRFWWSANFSPNNDHRSHKYAYVCWDELLTHRLCTIQTSIHVMKSSLVMLINRRRYN